MVSWSRQEFVEPMDRVLGDAGQNVDQPGLRISTSFIVAVTMMLCMAAARCNGVFQ
jgi:hypothetical protein